MAKNFQHGPFPFRLAITDDPLGLMPDGARKGRGKGSVPVRWKRDTTGEGKDYAVVNEWVSGQIAQALRLPVPPQGVTTIDVDGTAERLHAALEIDSGTDGLPFAIPDACVRNHPNLCAGILVFDIFIANPDRSTDNLYGSYPPSPKTLWIYDHEQALLGGRRGEGERRLAVLRDRLGLSWPECDGGDHHLFLKRVSSRDDILAWIRRIGEVPRWFYESVCEEARRIGLTESEAEALRMFLLHRRDGLEKIILDHGPLFEKVEWNPPGELPLCSQDS